VRDIISKGSSSAQLEYEVKMLTKTERESLLDSAIGSESSVVIPADDVLAMKADLCLTWKKLRVFRRYVIIPHTHTRDHYDNYLQRWMRAWKVSFASEAKERSLAKELVGPNLDAEAVAFTFPVDGRGGGEEIQKAPMAFVPDLVAKVTQILDQNDR
jgi:hypothetical protein